MAANISGNDFLGHNNDVQSGERLAQAEKLAATNDTVLGALALDPLTPTADGSMIDAQPAAQRAVAITPL
jgi:hypothetical protein